MRRLGFILLAVLLTWGTAFFVRQYHKPAESTEKERYQQLSWQGLYTTVNLQLKASPKKADSLANYLASFYENYTRQLDSKATLDSDIFNGQARDTIPLSENVWKLFRFGKEAYRISKGKVNPGIGNLLRTWGLLWKQDSHLPQKVEIEKAQKVMNELFYKVIETPRAIVLKKSAVHFALGAFDKGYAIDLGADILQKAGIRNYFLEIGGDIRFAGKNPRELDWRIGVQDPDQDNALLGVITTSFTDMNSMATSGGYRKFFVDSLGKRHHHILDPQTGWPAVGKKSVSAISVGAMQTDFWATYLFILDPEEAIHLVNSTKNLESIIVNDSGQILLSKGLKSVFQAKKITY